MQPDNTLAIIQEWQEAANRQDVSRLLELSDLNIEIIGPRGSGYGHQLLQDWLSRAGLTLETVRVFVQGKVAVVAQKGVWRSLETSEIAGEAQVASFFRVENGKVVQYARYDKLEEALDKAGLTYSDELGS